MKWSEVKWSEERADKGRERVWKGSVEESDYKNDNKMKNSFIKKGEMQR